MSHRPTTAHCIIDWLAKSVVILGLVAGLLYGSSYVFGYQKDLPLEHHGCPR